MEKGKKQTERKKKNTFCANFYRFACVNSGQKICFKIIVNRFLLFYVQYTVDGVSSSYKTIIISLWAYCNCVFVL